ncbi:MAG: putative dsRNA-binding protein, partial [Bdellovibrionaceae bacterium]|nr:putative dsRNA-binding protein [Pseudobdellovibrionaceae bacterium]
DQLADIAREIGVDIHLRLGRGERLTGGLQKPRILASTFEAVLGAVFLDQGYPAARAVVARLFEPRFAPFENGVADFARDYKTRLQELAQEKFRLTPTYHVEREEGPDHAKIFEISVRLNGQVLAVGQGRSKKNADQEAARLALETFKAAETSTESETESELESAVESTIESASETTPVTADGEAAHAGAVARDSESIDNQEAPE